MTRDSALEHRWLSPGHVAHCLSRLNHLASVQDIPLFAGRLP